MGKTTKPRRVDQKAVEILKLNDRIKQLEDQMEQLLKRVGQIQDTGHIYYKNADVRQTFLKKFVGHYKKNVKLWDNWNKSQQDVNKSLTRGLYQTKTRVKLLQRKIYEPIYEPLTEPPPDLFASFFGSEDLRSILSDEIALDFSDEQETNSQQKA
tara:strand:+ start:166 stop:630 length:465 start_codon:yes stop_codon:yes gene_type:complete